MQSRDVKRQAKPTLGEYSFQAGKETIQVLHMASGLIGVPYAREVVGIALALISACEVVCTHEIGYTR